MTGSPVTVEIEIAELVLDGFDPADRYKISEAITAELARQFTEHWAMSSGGSPAHLSQSFEMARLDAGSYQVAQDASPQKVGAQVASALWANISTLAKASLSGSASPAERAPFQERASPLEQVTFYQNRSGGSNE